MSTVVFLNNNSIQYEGTGVLQAAGIY